MAYVSDTNLSQFWGLAKNYIDKKDIAYANWQKTNADGAVACYPIPDFPLEPVVNFSFTETLPSGTKAPDNPSIITGVSSVNVTRCGKNLISKITPQTQTNNGVTFTVDSQGFVTTSGTAGSGNANFFYDMPPNALDIPVVKGHTYTISGCPSGGSSSTYCITTALFNKNGSAISYNVLNDAGNGKTWTATDDGYFWVVIVISSGYDSTGLVFKPQIEDLSYKTDYEAPDRNVYTLSLGSTYYGGSIDFATGLMNVTWEGIVLSSDMLLYTTSEDYVYRTNALALPTEYNPTGTTCSHYSMTNFSMLPDMPVNSFMVRSDGLIIVKTNGLSLQEWKDFLDAQVENGTPVTVCYPIKNPTTVQLTPQSVLSFSQSDKYTPCLNMLYSDQKSIQVGYAKSPIQTELDITNAILSLGGNI